MVWLPMGRSQRPHSPGILPARVLRLTIQIRLKAGSVERFLKPEAGTHTILHSKRHKLAGGAFGVRRHVRALIRRDMSRRRKRRRAAALKKRYHYHHRH